MRQLHEHQVNECNQQLTIEVMDEPGAGGACHVYSISGFDTATNASVKGPEGVAMGVVFQNGPIPEKGVNGITQEVLLAICIDRLRGFQSGEFACRENALALTHLETALMWLNKRTRDRERRGVEGTHKK